MSMPSEPERRNQPYDLSLRAVVSAWPQDYVRLLVGGPARLVEVIDPNLPASDRTADFTAVVEYPDAGRFLLHGEFQTEYDADIAFRMLEYRVRLAARYAAYAGHIYSVVLYLTDEGYPGAGYNRLEERVLGHRQLTFEFREVRLWEVPAQEALHSGEPGVLPLLPLMAGASEAILPETVRAIDAVEDERTRTDLLVGLVVLGGLRLQGALIRQVIERTTMRHNTFFEAYAAVRTQEIRFETTREMILRTLRQRFKRVSKKIEERLPLIRDQQQLEQLHDLAVSCPDQKAFIAAMPPPTQEPEWPPSVTGGQTNPRAGS